MNSAGTSRPTPQQTYKAIIAELYATGLREDHPDIGLNTNKPRPIKKYRPDKNGHRMTKWEAKYK